MAEEPKKKLDEILSGMGPAPSTGGGLFASLKKRDEPPPPPVEPAGPPEPTISDQVRSLEAKLAEVSEKAMQATLRLQEREAAQREMEQQFQQLRAQQRAEEAQKTERDLAARMQGRVQSLEERLDKQLSDMQTSWAGLAKEMVSSRETSAAGERLAALEAEQRRWRDETAALRQENELARASLQRLEALNREMTVRLDAMAAQEKSLAEAAARSEAAHDAKERALAEHMDRSATELAGLRQEAREARTVVGRMVALEDALKTLLTRFSLAQDDAGRHDLDLQRLKREMETLPTTLEARLSDMDKAARERDENRRADAAALALRVEAIESWSQEVQKALGDASSDLRMLAGGIDELKAALEQSASESRRALDQAAAGLGARLEGVNRRLSTQEDAAGRLASGLSGLEAALSRAVEGLASLGDRMAAMESTLDIKLGTVESNATGLMNALPEQVMERVRQELTAHAARVEEVLKRVSAVEGTAGLAMRAIPEGLLQRLRAESGRLEQRLAALEGRLGGGS